MTVYEFRCGQGHTADRRFPMGSAPRAVVCAECGDDARRVFTTPRLRTFDPAVARHIDMADRSAEAPEVVREIPPAARRRPAPPANPRLASLPRM